MRRSPEITLSAISLTTFIVLFVILYLSAPKCVIRQSKISVKLVLVYSIIISVFGWVLGYAWIIISCRLHIHTLL